VPPTYWHEGDGNDRDDAPDVAVGVYVGVDTNEDAHVAAALDGLGRPVGQDRCRRRWIDDVVPRVGH
jgi:hypothetical protein